MLVKNDYHLPYKLDSVHIEIINIPITFYYTIN